MSRLRVLVCGTTFGQSYLAALARLPDEFELAGVLGRGSGRSADTARRAGVPLYTDVGELPDDIDMACVIVRSSLMGGPGSELARTLLARGIHVLQEQPVHHDDLAESLKVARAHGVRMRMGDLYPQLPAVRVFADAARELAARQRPVYIDAACAVQVSLPLLHTLGEALGTVRPWRFASGGASGPFTVVTGEIGGVPLVLRVQNEIAPEDPDNHMHLLHRVTIGFDGGGLTLHDAHGPVSFTPRLHIPDSVRTAFDFTAPEAGHLTRPATSVLDGPPPTQWEFLRDVLPSAIGRDLLDLRAAVIGLAGASRPEQYHLTLCRMWRDLTTELGYATLLTGQEHRPVAVPGPGDA
ncbi:Gfo/Idh/MocA family oxidoreductase [Saccharopolyspora phatthalungensis]|uniref:Thiazolinyl imide reductase n=1 Tax=Saccharopolyspora phatthalungensis TaxID=664693 RepID=A0A840Q8Y0_9PSEU|nr:Gfo/Idh/MocA family oxidoreductase [Saccharopolyspora phatthalungensis]MBB5158992.1 thiazolinyl imide reductase [Saccharopolyspora phatthalungensis]